MPTDNEPPAGDEQPRPHDRLGKVAHLDAQRAAPVSPVLADDSVDLSLAVPADAGHARQLRHRLRDWLATQHLPPEFCAEVLLASDESVSNAVEHSYQDDQRGPVALSARRTATELVLTIADQGKWRVPPCEPHLRGHGLGIIRAVSAHVDIDTNVGGTVVTAHITLPSSHQVTPGDQ